MNIIYTPASLYTETAGDGRNVCVCDWNIATCQHAATARGRHADIGGNGAINGGRKHAADVDKPTQIFEKLSILKKEQFF